jgi:hypothetical protein
VRLLLPLDHQCASFTSCSSISPLLHARKRSVALQPADMSMSTRSLSSSRMEDDCSTHCHHLHIIHAASLPVCTA